MSTLHHNPKTYTFPENGTLETINVTSESFITLQFDVDGISITRDFRHIRDEDDGEEQVYSVSYWVRKHINAVEMSKTDEDDDWQLRMWVSGTFHDLYFRSDDDEQTKHAFNLLKLIKEYIQCTM